MANHAFVKLPKPMGNAGLLKIEEWRSGKLFEKGGEEMK